MSQIEAFERESRSPFKCTEGWRITSQDEDEEDHKPPRQHLHPKEVPRLVKVLLGRPRKTGNFSPFPMNEPVFGGLGRVSPPPSGTLLPSALIELSRLIFAPRRRRLFGAGQKQKWLPDMNIN